jgi:D-glycero-D-manno-heptose 1,7-bisphosphate phosphatase
LLQFVFTNGKKEARGPALFIDRDGVINCRRPGDYVLNWSQFIFMPGIREAMRQLSSLGLPMIVISNQAGVGKGLLKPEVLEGITAQMRQILLTDGTPLAAAYYCPHTREENCDCRKPKPGLLYKAADDFNVDISRSIFIGDSDTDVQAARAVGCQPVLFGSDLGDSSRSSGWATDLPTAHTAAELFDMVVKCLQERGHPASDDHVARPSVRQ